MKIKSYSILLPILLLLTGCNFLNINSCDEIKGTIYGPCIPAEYITLSSGGGNINAAIFIANLTEETHVIDHCDSACIMISSRGNYRTACPNTTFGFHQASSPEGTDRVLKFFAEDSRINLDHIINFTYSADNTKLFKVDTDMAILVGILDKTINCKEN